MITVQWSRQATHIAWPSSPIFTFFLPPPLFLLAESIYPWLSWSLLLRRPGWSWIQRDLSASVWVLGLRHLPSQPAQSCDLFVVRTSQILCFKYFVMCSVPFLAQSPCWEVGHYVVSFWEIQVIHVHLHPASFTVGSIMGALSFSVLCHLAIPS